MAVVFKPSDRINIIEALNDADIGGGGGETYTLPPATPETLGGIKVGANLTVEDDGTLNATGGGSGTLYQPGEGISIVGSTISVNFASDEDFLAYMGIGGN